MSNILDSLFPTDYGHIRTKKIGTSTTVVVLIIFGSAP